MNLFQRRLFNLELRRRTSSIPTTTRPLTSSPAVCLALERECRRIETETRRAAAADRVAVAVLVALRSSGRSHPA